jgi:beta-galactosidase
MKNLNLILVLIVITVFSLNAQIPETKVIMGNGSPQLFINGKKILPIMTFVNTGIPESYKVNQRQVKYAAEYGDIHLHQVNFALPMTADGNFDFTMMKSSLDLIRHADPKGFAIVRIHLNDNCNSHGGYTDEDRVKFSNGNLEEEISIASDKWMQNASKKIAALADFCDKNPEYGKLIVGYFPAAAETGEWFQWKHREYGVDLSVVNTNKFRLWLKKKYHNNIQKLQTSWHARNVNFKNAQIPSDELGTQKVNRNDGKFFDKPSDQRILDYLDYYNEMTADRIVHLAKLIKQTTNNKVLVGFFYGYIFDLWDAKSGHYRLETILDCPDINFLASPINYQSRNEGGIGGSMTLVQSVQNHGKIWFDECDFRSPIRTATGANFDDHMPYVKTSEGLIEIYRRQLGYQMIRGNGCWPMDLMGRGWYDDKNFWKEIKSLKELFSQYEKIRSISSPEVALVIDEYGMTLSADPNFNKWMLGRLRDELYSAGVNFGIYQRKDIEAGYVPDAKLYIMVGAFRLDRDIINNLTQVLHQKGKTTVWIYSLGVGPDFYAKKIVSEKNGSKQFIYPSNIIKADTIRAMAKKSGAHVFISGGYDACMANKNIIVLHTKEGGKRSINLPGKFDVYEQFSGKWYNNVNAISLNVLPAETYIFFYGRKENLQKNGIGIHSSKN